MTLNEYITCLQEFAKKNPSARELPVCKQTPEDPDEEIQESPEIVEGQYTDSECTHHSWNVGRYVRL